MNNSQEATELLDESEKEFAEKVRIFGIDPGYIPDPTIVDLADLTWIWVSIDIIRCTLDSVSQLEKAGVENLQEYKVECEYAFEYLTYKACIRLGIPVSTPTKGEHIKPHSDYYRWYEFNFKNIKLAFTPEELDELILAFTENGDTSRFIPKGDWRVS